MKNLKETNENLAVDTSAEVDITTTENVVTKILTKGEEILLKRTPNKKSYLSAAITGAVCGMLVLGIANAFLVYFLLQNGLNTNEIIGLIFTGIFDIVAIIYCLKLTIFAVFGVKHIQYIFTNKRIVLVSGTNDLKTEYIYYTDITSVKLKVGLIDKIYKVGDIYIHANNHTHFLFDIDDEDKIYNFVLQHAVAIDKDKTE